VTGTRTPGGARWEAPGWRRAPQLALAALWLLDAVQQYQTFMFSQGFPRMLAATAAGNPAGVAAPVAWSAHLIGTHPAAANARAGRAPRAHVLSCSAMVCVLLAAPTASAGVGADPGTGALPVVALILAVAVSVSVVVSTDRLPAVRPAPVPVTTAPAQAPPAPAQVMPAPAQVMPTAATGQDAAAGFTPAPAGARPVLCPRLAACCQIMMDVAMAYMLILML
jgi:hypothetical protein